MSRRPAPVRVVLPTTDPHGSCRFDTDLAVATTVSRWTATGAPVHLWLGEPTGTPADWAERVRRGTAAVLVVTDGEEPALAARWAQCLHGQPVAGAGLDQALRRVLPGHEPAEEGTVGPYSQGVLPAELVARVGLDAACGSTLAELEHIARHRSAQDGQVLLHGLPLGTDSTHARHRAVLVAAACRHALDLVPVVRAADLDLPVATVLADFASVVLRAEVGDAPGLMAALVAAAQVGLDVTARLDLRGVADTGHGRLPVEVAALVKVHPDLELDASASQLRRLAARGTLSGVRPTSTLARLVRADSARGRRARERMVAGEYPAVPLVMGPHDVWWDHEDGPAEHAPWLSSLVPVGAHLHLAQHHDSSAWSSWVNVSDYRPITAYSRLDPGTGEGLAVLASADCLDAFLGDARAAWSGEPVPSRLLGPSVAGLCAVSGPCWSAGGRRLHVDRTGQVRGCPHGDPVGTVGDPFSDIRARLRSRGTTGCRGGPPEPWLRRVLDGRAALRAVGDLDATATASGFGTPLLHSFGRGEIWPEGIAMVRTSGGYHVHDALSGSTAHLDRGRATTLELVWDLGPRAAGVLSQAGRTRVEPDQVLGLAAALVTRLRAATPAA